MWFWRMFSRRKCSCSLRSVCMGITRLYTIVFSVKLDYYCIIFIKYFCYSLWPVVQSATTAVTCTNHINLTKNSKVRSIDEFFWHFSREIICFHKKMLNPACIKMVFAKYEICKRKNGKLFSHSLTIFLIFLKFLF